MPDFDTDSQMMRRQQGLDAPETVEGAPANDRTDSDAKSARDRREAGAGARSFDGDQQDAVLEQNSGRSNPDPAGHPAKGERPPLAAKDRSILGD